jgi:hypothetical protein
MNADWFRKELNREARGAVVHELVQQRNGQLTVRIPKSIDQAFSSKLPLQLQQALGKAEMSGNAITVVSPESFGAAAVGSMPERCKIEAGVREIRLHHTGAYCIGRVEIGMAQVGSRKIVNTVFCKNTPRHWHQARSGARFRLISVVSRVK